MGGNGLERRLWGGLSRGALQISQSLVGGVKRHHAGLAVFVQLQDALVFSQTQQEAATIANGEGERQRLVVGDETESHIADLRNEMLFDDGDVRLDSDGSGLLMRLVHLARNGSYAVSVVTWVCRLLLRLCTLDTTSSLTPFAHIDRLSAQPRL